MVFRVVVRISDFFITALGAFYNELWRGYGMHGYLKGRSFKHRLCLNFL